MAQSDQSRSPGEFPLNPFFLFSLYCLLIFSIRPTFALEIIHLSKEKIFSGEYLRAHPHGQWLLNSQAAGSFLLDLSGKLPRSIATNLTHETYPVVLNDDWAMLTSSGFAFKQQTGLAFFAWPATQNFSKKSINFTPIYFDPTYSEIYHSVGVDFYDKNSLTLKVVLYQSWLTKKYYFKRDKKNWIFQKFDPPHSVCPFRPKEISMPLVSYDAKYFTYQSEGNLYVVQFRGGDCKQLLSIPGNFSKPSFSLPSSKEPKLYLTQSDYLGDGVTKQVPYMIDLNTKQIFKVIVPETILPWERITYPAEVIGPNIIYLAAGKNKFGIMEQYIVKSEIRYWDSPKEDFKNYHNLDLSSSANCKKSLKPFSQNILTIFQSLCL